MTRKASLIILILVSIGVHFAFFGQPNEIVFDEVHFGKFVSAYYTHQYYFDIHPPGGKLIIAGFAKILSAKGGPAFGGQPFNFTQIGQPFPDHKYLALRFLPILAGTLLPIIIYFLALELGFPTLGAFGAGILVALENSLLTQSRYILLDPFLLLFGFTSLLFYLKYYNTNLSLTKGTFVNYKLWYNIFLMAVFGGLAASIKWTGLAFIGLAGIVELFKIANYGLRITDQKILHLLKNISKFIIFFVLIPFLIYFSIFTIHFSLLTKSGDGDAFMTPAFQKTLAGSAYANDTITKPLNVFQKFIELNKEMYQANKTLTATHPYSSKWYTWPFMTRPIYYWNKTSTIHLEAQPPSESRIYFIGNPFIWWASTVSILYLVFSIMYETLRNSVQKYKIPDTRYLILIGGWAINLLPFIGIGRVMFLYHYLSALIFAILALAYLIDQSKNSRKIWLLLLVISFLSFVYFAPLSYGLPLDATAFQHRLWLTTWQ